MEISYLDGNWKSGKFILTLGHYIAIRRDRIRWNARLLPWNCSNYHGIYWFHFPRWYISNYTSHTCILNKTIKIIYFLKLSRFFSRFDRTSLWAFSWSVRRLGFRWFCFSDGDRFRWFCSFNISISPKSNFQPVKHQSESLTYFECLLR